MKTMKLMAALFCGILLLQACDSSNTVTTENVESIAGTVHANGAPLADATVAALSGTNVLAQDVTDSVGTFLLTGFSAVADGITLRVHHEDFEVLEMSYNDWQNQPTNVVNMPASVDTCCASVQVVVRDSSSNVLLDHVDVWLRNGGTTFGRDTTDSTGTVLFSDICHGEYEVRLAIEGRPVIEYVFEVDSCEEAQLEILMQEDCCDGAATFTVLDDESEEGVGGVLVKLWNNGAVVATKETNEGGTATFLELCQGGYGVDFIKEGFESTETTFELGCGQEKDFTVTMQSAEQDTCCDGVLWLTVKDTEGTPQEEVKVRLWQQGSLVEYLYTNGDGVVVFDGICEGDYAVDAIWNNSEVGFEFEMPCNGEVSETLTVEASEECCDNVLILHALAQESEQPIVEAKIQVWDNGEKVQTLYTNSDGLVIIDGLCTGDYWFDIIREGYVAQEFRVEFSCTDTVELTKQLAESTSEECCTAVMKLKIRDSESEAFLQGAEVRLTSEGAVVETLVSNGDGFVIFDGLCAPRTYAIRVAKDGYAVKEFTWTLEECKQFQETVWLE